MVVSDVVGEPLKEHHEPLSKILDGGSPSSLSSHLSSKRWLTKDQKRKRRCYQRCISGLEYWTSCLAIVRYLTLSTRVGSVTIKDLPILWDRFIKIVRYQYHCKIQYVKVIGVGQEHGMLHIHSLIANTGYLPQAELVKTWQYLTDNQSRGVDIRIVDTHRVSKKKLAGYLPGYLQQSGGYYSRSRNWLYPGAIDHWFTIKQVYGPTRCDGDAARRLKMEIAYKYWNLWLHSIKFKDVYERFKGKTVLRRYCSTNLYSWIASHPAPSDTSLSQLGGG